MNGAANFIVFGQRDKLDKFRMTVFSDTDKIIIITARAFPGIDYCPENFNLGFFGFYTKKKLKPKNQNFLKTQKVCIF